MTIGNQFNKLALFMPALLAITVYGQISVGPFSNPQEKTKQTAHNDAYPVRDYSRKWNFKFINVKDSVPVYFSFIPWSTNYAVNGAVYCGTNGRDPGRILYGTQLSAGASGGVTFWEKLNTYRTAEGNKKHHWTFSTRQGIYHKESSFSGPLSFYINKPYYKISPEQKNTTGLIIPLNDNDSNDNGQEDRLDTNCPSGDPDLVELEAVHPFGAEVSFNYNHSAITLFESNSKRLPCRTNFSVSFSSRIGAASSCGPYCGGYDDNIIYVEGIQPTSTVLRMTGPRGFHDDLVIRVLKPPRLIPDFNHDCEITEEDYELSTNDTFRFWCNNDDDQTADSGTDSACISAVWDGNDYVVDSVRDLIDFFPVYLDLCDAISAFGTENYRYELYLEGAASYAYPIYQDAMGLVYTMFSPSNAGGHLQNVTLAEALGNATVERFGYENNHLVLDEVFLNKIVTMNKGVVLLEAQTAVDNRNLVLAIVDKDTGHEIVTVTMALNVTGVENMYRWVNLREAGGGTANLPTNLNPPSNYPDSLCDNKNFVFVHGYSVSEEQARGWSAEIFKRFFWAGSRAKFTAVTWFGNDSQISGWLPWLGDVTPNYYINVEHAFETADELATVVNGLSGPSYIAGHSLGNMLVSSAIVDHGLNANAYFMLNAAVAMESYNPNVLQRDEMGHPNWQNYSNKLWASDWHELYTTNDSRGYLTWRGRFSGLSNAYDYYSEGEDVLNNGDGSVPSLGGECAWVNQEMRKGTWLISVGPGNSEAGWEFNYGYVIGEDELGYPVYGKLEPAAANLLSPSELMTNSFFKHFDDEELYGVNGNTFLLDGQANVRYSEIYCRLLADGIPAISRPMGRNSLSGFGLGSANMNSSSMKNGWPSVRTSDPDLGTRWLHSDIKNIAFPYVYKVFDDIATKGLR